MDELGWPVGFFKTIAGGWEGEPLSRAPQGDRLKEICRELALDDSVAGELPPKLTRHRVVTAVSCRTDEALFTSLRRHLHDCLSLVPSDL